MKVSVLLPAHNAARYIERTVTSLLSQTVSGLEILAVDDGSTDQTPDLLDRLAAEDPRLQVTTRPNTGIVGALNDGLETAVGEFVARIDDADVAAPDRLAQQMAYLEANPGVALVGSDVLLVDPEGRPLRVRRHPRAHADIYRRLAAGDGAALTHPAILMRTDLLRRIGGYRQEALWAEDLDLYLRMAQVGELANLPAVLTEIRQFEDSVSERFWETQRDVTYQVLLAAHRRDEIPEPSLPVPTEPPAPARLRWIYWAIADGNTSSARAIALSLLSRSPGSLPNWVAAFRAFAARPKKEPSAP